jgi:hypothetical protein
MMMIDSSGTKIMPGDVVGCKPLKDSFMFEIWVQEPGKYVLIADYDSSTGIGKYEDPITIESIDPTELVIIKRGTFYDMAKKQFNKHENHDHHHTPAAAPAPAVETMRDVSYADLAQAEVEVCRRSMIEQMLSVHGINPKANAQDIEAAGYALKEDHDQMTGAITLTMYHAIDRRSLVARHSIKYEIINKDLPDAKNK